MPQVDARVLFVDDVEFNVLLGVSALERIGCEVIGLTNSLEALNVFRTASDKFDLVITDQTMPHFTGYELAQQLLVIRPDIPIFLVTGHSEFVNEEMAKSIGIREFFMKPIDIYEIANAIEKAIS